MSFNIQCFNCHIQLYDFVNNDCATNIRKIYSVIVTLYKEHIS